MSQVSYCPVKCTTHICPYTHVLVVRHGTNLTYRINSSFSLLLRLHPVIYADALCRPLYPVIARHLFNYIYINLQSTAYIMHALLTAQRNYSLMNYFWSTITERLEKVLSLIIWEISRTIRSGKFGRFPKGYNYDDSVTFKLQLLSNRFMNVLLITKCKNKIVIIVTLQSGNHSHQYFALLIFKFSLYVSVCELSNACNNKCWFNGDKATSNTQLVSLPPPCRISSSCSLSYLFLRAPFFLISCRLQDCSGIGTIRA